MQAIVVVTTVGTEEQAHVIAREVIARRLAACVNIVPGVRSVYRWKGSICTDSEWMLVAKTRAEEFDALAATIQELHSYELPEILSFPVHRGDPRCLEWVASSVDKDADFADDDEESADGTD